MEMAVIVADVCCVMDTIDCSTDSRNWSLVTVLTALLTLDLNGTTFQHRDGCFNTVFMRPVES